MRVLLSLLLLLIYLFSSLPLSVISSATCSLGLSCDQVESGDLLYRFSGGAVLLDENYNPVKIGFRVVNDTVGPTYRYGRDYILEFVEGTEFYD